MKDYIKPILEDEEIELEDVIAASGEFGIDNTWKDGDIDFSD